MKPWQNSEGYNDPTAYGAIKAENTLALAIAIGCGGLDP